MSFVHTPDSPLSRRTMLASLAAAAAGAGLMPVLAREPRTGRSRGKLDFRDPRDNLKAFVKLTSDASGAPTVGWYCGHVFGVSGNEILKPLFGVEGFGTGCMVRQPDGSYKASWKEVGYYTDLKSGQILETWSNPYNGDACEVMHIHNRAVNSIVGTAFPDLSAMAATGDLKLEFDNYADADDPARPFIRPWIVLGDDASLWQDFRGKVKNLLDPKVWTRESTGEYIRVSEFFQNTGSLALLEDDSVANVPSTGTWNRLAPWLPWMLMGRHDGHLFYRCSTRKLAKFEQLPRKILDYTEKHFASFLDYNTPWVMPNESSWEVYARERKPVPAKTSGGG